MSSSWKSANRHRKGGLSQFPSREAFIILRRRQAELLIIRVIIHNSFGGSKRRRDKSLTHFRCRVAFIAHVTFRSISFGKNYLYIYVCL